MKQFHAVWWEFDKYGIANPERRHPASLGLKPGVSDTEERAAVAAEEGRPFDLGREGVDRR